MADVADKQVHGVRRRREVHSGRAAARGPARTLLLLVLLAIACCAIFMTIGAHGNWSFVLPFRAPKLVAMILVGHAIALSTVVFQTLSGNRILTPSIMGFDALYGLIQTLMVAFAGTLFATGAETMSLFLAQTLAMIGFALALYGTLLGKGAHDLHRLLLVGVIVGVLFRSLSGFLQRLIDPNAFVVLQDRLYASFSTIETDLLAVAAVLIGLVTLSFWRLLPQLDVLALGRETATSLGVDPVALTRLSLGLIAVLVSVSTALVGPVTFFGLLVASLAVSLVGSRRHAETLVAASLIAVICLVGGQTLLERVFHFDTALGIVIEFLGGIVFLAIVVKRGIR
ncbi:iron chelate uptake ABC transporter family permease subunit [Aurantimonas sp. VKM B-3413]|uniref:iron chelate uptake ABC transporter family permease subunit n=1 Tax=Aurantimonas sp. VKM B-3413 TaxID=2779401 RepID=UPI001E29D5D3|nr:iron chelate uptake ABC transporter family permease subunit [Aurantimonas sp. VKM B-3413]MCB8839444.1 iron chelate uptake ABC transporter family permease subunit [Aurantimonas sp. VKM B-3413]